MIVVVALVRYVLIVRFIYISLLLFPILVYYSSALYSWQGEKRKRQNGSLKVRTCNFDLFGRILVVLKSFTASLRMVLCTIKVLFIPLGYLLYFRAIFEDPPLPKAFYHPTTERSWTNMRENVIYSVFYLFMLFNILLSSVRYCFQKVFKSSYTLAHGKTKSDQKFLQASNSLRVGYYK